jgi:DNA-binding PadR family transcriptional regulator
VGLTESTRFAVLGLTLDGPTYSYAIAEEIRRWPLDEEIAPNRRAVYHAVDWLVTERFLAQSDEELRMVAGIGGGVADVAMRGAPVRKLVAATPLGAERFKDWLLSPIVTEQDLLWRVGAARLADVPTLLRVISAAEQTWLSRLQDQATPNAAALAGRQPSWRATKLALLNAIRGKQLDGEAGVIRDVKALLADVQRESGLKA